jgi:hypothetical protein
VQFIVLSDVNANDYATRVSVPIFREPTAGRPAWAQMQPGAVKHDTFVYNKLGERTLFWDTSSEVFSEWSTDIRAAVEAAR